MSGFTEEAFIVKNLDSGESFHVVQDASAVDAYVKDLSTFAKEGAAREIRVAIATSEKNTSFDGKSYTSYCLEISLQRGYVGETALIKKWEVWRRYRDFVALDTELRSNPSHAAMLKMVSLPSKSIFGSLSAAVVRQRMLALNAYINAVASILDGKIRGIEALCGFLSVPLEFCSVSAPTSPGAADRKSDARRPVVLLTLAEAARKYPALRAQQL